MEPASPDGLSQQVNIHAMSVPAQAPGNQPPVATINYQKLMRSLMVVVSFFEFIEHWPEFKAGFRDGYHSAQPASSP